MKIAFILNQQSGAVSQHLAVKLLEKTIAAAGDEVCELTDNPQLIIVLGDLPLDASHLVGKQYYCCQALQAIQDPAAALANAKQGATRYEPTSAKTAAPLSSVVKIVAVTACPTGVAHTFMAAEAIENEAKKRGWQCQVETRGSVGVGNPLSQDIIAQADVVIIAADIDVDMQPFVGKRVYRTKTGVALKKTAQELDNALQNATIYQPNQPKMQTAAASEKKGAYQHLLTGVSYMLPMVVAGGLIIALSFAVGGIEQQGKWAQALALIGGKSALALMVPLLAGYIAYSIADRPGLTPGLIGGMLSTSVGAGFLGGIVAGYLAGYVTQFLSKWIRLPSSLDALKPILLLPFLASTITGLAMIFLLGTPIAYLMTALENGLSQMQTSNAVILGAILGGMMCTDMGGPINKVAYAFGVGLLSSQYYTPMAAIMAGGMVPPLAMSLATLLAKNKFSQTERESGKVAFVLGLSFISEGAIPFAARDPMRVLPACIIGGAVTGGISMAIGAKLMAPHGGLFVLAIPGAVVPVLGYLFAIAAGSIIAGCLYAVAKRPTTEAENPDSVTLSQP